MKHRIVSLLLAVLLIVTLLPGAANAADTGKVRVIVENTAMREETYQGFQVPWKDLRSLGFQFITNPLLTADGALEAAAKEHLMGFISVEDYLAYDGSGLLASAVCSTGEARANGSSAVRRLDYDAQRKVQAGDTVRVHVHREPQHGRRPRSYEHGQGTCRAHVLRLALSSPSPAKRYRRATHSNVPCRRWVP